MPMDDPRLRSMLDEAAPGRVSFGVPLRDYTTFGVGGPAAALVQPESAEELAAVLDLCQKENLPRLILGLGSNLLVMDEGFEGVAIRLGRAFQMIEFLEGQTIRAGAAVRASRLVAAATGAGLAGLECLTGIPATLGGALMMNASSGGNAVGERVLRIFTIDGQGRQEAKSLDDLKFEYRRLRGLNDGAVITGAEFHLIPDRADHLEARVEEMLAQRSRTQPKGARSAGCFFKNPPEGAAGRLIDRCGLKGRTVGGAQVSPIHANFIVNTGGATAADILALAEMVAEEVAERFGVILQREVKIIGPQGEVE